MRSSWIQCAVALAVFGLVGCGGPEPSGPESEAAAAIEEGGTPADVGAAAEEANGQNDEDEY